MIYIGRPVVTEINNKFRLSARITINTDCRDKWMEHVTKMRKLKEYPYEYKENMDLWYEVDSEYGECLTFENADAFVIAILYFAIATGEDICCTAPISEQLYYQLQNIIITSFCNNSGTRQIKILADTSTEQFSSQNAVGTGISCGVDSLTTLFLNLEDTVPKSRRITHGVLINGGAFHKFSNLLRYKSMQKCNEEAETAFEKKAKKAQCLMNELNLPLVKINTNMEDLYQSGFLYTESFRNISAIHAVSKLFSVYYLAAAGYSFRQCYLLDDSARYDDILVPNLSTENLQCCLGDVSYNRVQKTKYIGKMELVKKYLDVCDEKDTNCGHCGKCIRTLITLDMLGMIDEYKDLFDDIQYFSGHRDRIYASVWYWSRKKTHRDEFFYQIYDYMNLNGIKFTKKARIYSKLIALNQLRRKLKK